MMSNFVLGLDLGQAAEFSALCVLEGSLIPQTGPKPPRHYGCRDLQRCVPGTGYPAIVAGVEALVQAPELQGATLVLGITGVGRPVLEFFERANLPIDIEAAVVAVGSTKTASRAAITSLRWS